jgi:hypothetical protein
MLRAPLGEVLKKLGFINDDQLTSALAYQRQTNLPLGRALVLLGHCNAEALTRALAAQSGAAYLDLSKEPINPTVTAMVSAETARRFGVVPVRLDEKRSDNLLVACRAPIRFQALDEVRRTSGKRAVPFLASDESVDAAVLRLYGSPPVPAPVPEEEVPVIELTSDDTDFASSETPQRPVLLFGWNHEATVALQGMCATREIPVRVATASEVRQCREEDILISPLQSMEAFVSTGLRPAAQWIVAGPHAERGPTMARQLGAKEFIPTPIVSMLLLGAIGRLRGLT